MLVLKVRRDVDAVEGLHDDLLVRLLRRRRLASRLVDLDAVHEEHTLVLCAQTFQHGYGVLCFVAPGKLKPQMP